MSKTIETEIITNRIEDFIPLQIGHYCVSMCTNNDEIVVHEVNNRDNFRVINIRHLVQSDKDALIDTVLNDKS